ncbi:hypothetical protein AAFF_G00107900 [Aldrovandia affinis]|uniref:Uncharacterized protein n=1 Tax=Aldrovandia affinis TaxID=143900 RepID=A0AAD7RWM3_9TELE|nr:hypothetical protein AAFF_G00107900 [Aldrovandia affinis]
MQRGVPPLASDRNPASRREGGQEVSDLRPCPLPPGNESPASFCRFPPCTSPDSVPVIYAPTAHPFPLPRPGCETHGRGKFGAGIRACQLPGGFETSGLGRVLPFHDMKTGENSFSN